MLCVYHTNIVIKIIPNEKYSNCFTWRIYIAYIPMCLEKDENMMILKKCKKISEYMNWGCECVFVREREKKQIIRECVCVKMSREGLKKKWESFRNVYSWEDDEEKSSINGII